MKTDQSAFLHHILDAIAKIEKYISGFDEEAFKVNDLVQDGVIRQNKIIGEAVKRLSKYLMNQSPQVPGRISPVCGINSFTITLELILIQCG